MKTLSEYLLEAKIALLKLESALKNSNEQNNVPFQLIINELEKIKI